MRPTLLFVVVVFPLIAACAEKQQPQEAATAPAAAAPAPAPPPGKGESPADRDQVDADGVVRRGEALTAAAPLSVDDCLREAQSLDGKAVKLSGVVDQVCSKKGCWFALKGEQGKTIRITSKGYRFFMPRSSTGQRAVVEGELKVTTLSKEEAQHLEDDRVEGTGEAPRKVEGEQVEIQVAAVGVEMRSGS